MPDYHGRRGAAFLIVLPMLVALVAPSAVAAQRGRVDCDLDPGALAVAAGAATPGQVLAVTGACSGGLVIDRDLTIRGAAGGGWSLSAPGSGPFVLVVAGWVRIEDAEIRGGISGGIVNRASLMLVDSSITGSEDWGVDNAGTLELRRSVVGEGNKGGVHNTGHLIVRDSVLRDVGRFGHSQNVGLENHGDALIVRTEVLRNRLGGIVNDGDLIVRDSTIVDNTADEFGGDGAGIRNSGTARITGTEIRGNLAGDGNAGGIWNGGDLVIRDSAITGNIARGGGGGGILNDGDLIIKNTSVSGNSASGPPSGGQADAVGGGIWNRGTMVGRELDVVANDARRAGGGIRNDGRLELRNSSVTDNVASEEGGGLSHGGASLTLLRVTFSGNAPDDCKGC